MSRGVFFTIPVKLGASWCAGDIALLKSQSLPFWPGNTKNVKAKFWNFTGQIKE